MGMAAVVTSGLMVGHILDNIRMTESPALASSSGPTREDTLDSGSMASSMAMANFNRRDWNSLQSTRRGRKNRCLILTLRNYNLMKRNLLPPSWIATEWLEAPPAKPK